MTLKTVARRPGLARTAMRLIGKEEKAELWEGPVLTRAARGQGDREAMPLSCGKVVSMVSGSGSRCGWHGLPTVVNNHDMKVGLSRVAMETMKRWKLWALGLTSGSGGVLVRWCCYPGEVMLLRSSTRHGQGGGAIIVPMADEDNGKAKLG